MLFISLSISISSKNSDILEPPSQMVSNRQLVEARVPDKSKIEEFKKDSRFDYAVKKQESADVSWFDRLWFSFLHFISNLFDDIASSRSLSFVVIAVAVIFVCFLLLKLFGVDYRTLLGRNKVDIAEIDIYTENVHEMNFEQLIANALSNKDYRLVVRFLYLKSLKLLTDKQIIEWKTNKTNYSYQYEINNSDLRKKFLEATLIFDYVWYGELELEEGYFSELSSRLNDFNKMIANEG